MPKCLRAAASLIVLLAVACSHLSFRSLSSDEPDGGQAGAHQYSASLSRWDSRVTIPSRLGGKLNAKICRILTESFSGAFSPKELCNRHGGSFRLSMETMEQAVCAAAGASFCSSAKPGEALCRAVDGSFCSSMSGVASGYCSVLDGSSCDDAKPSEEDRFRRRILVDCDQIAREMATKDAPPIRCTESNIHGSFPKGGGCNIYGCWPAGGSCNIYGCTRVGECAIRGCEREIKPGTLCP